MFILMHTYSGEFLLERGELKVFKTYNEAFNCAIEQGTEWACYEIKSHCTMNIDDFRAHSPLFIRHY